MLLMSQYNVQGFLTNAKCTNPRSHLDPGDHTIRPLGQGLVTFILLLELSLFSDSIDIKLIL